MRSVLIPHIRISGGAFDGNTIRREDITPSIFEWKKTRNLDVASKPKVWVRRPRRDPYWYFLAQLLANWTGNLIRGLAAGESVLTWVIFFAIVGWTLALVEFVAGVWK